jgi:hypothetical protein
VDRIQVRPCRTSDVGAVLDLWKRAYGGQRPLAKIKGPRILDPENVGSRGPYSSAKALTPVVTTTTYCLPFGAM